MRWHKGNWVAWTQTGLTSDSAARPLKEKDGLRLFGSMAAALDALGDANPKYVMELTSANREQAEKALLSGTIPPD